MAPQPLSAAERDARLMLSLIPRVGSRTFERLLDRFGSAAAALAAAEIDLGTCVGPALARAIADPTGHPERLRRERAGLARLGATAICRGDPNFPAELEDLARTPPILYLRGDLPATPRAGIVGRRQARGQDTAKAMELANFLTERGYCIVSGGAYGIDAAAHRGALDAGGSTVVVFGGALDRPYPDRHIPLFETVVGRGAIASAYRLGTPPRRGGFLARNHLIAALGEFVVVVAAGWHSGALSTARAALRLGKTVFVVPGTPGCDRLCAEGAISIRGAPDLGRVLAGASAGPEPEALEPDAEAVWRALAQDEARSPAAVAVASGQPIATVQAALMELLLAGLASELPGGGYVRLPRALTTETRTDTDADR